MTENLFSAKDSALGYLYQCRLALLYALRRLKESDDVEIAIESLDDVTFSVSASRTTSISAPGFNARFSPLSSVRVSSTRISQ
jgi:hypothetical protein